MGVKLRNHLGDVIRALHGTEAETDQQCAQVARMLGFDWVAPVSKSTPTDEPKKSSSSSSSAQTALPLTQQTVADASESWLQSVAVESMDDVPQWYTDAAPLQLADHDDLERSKPIQPLFPAHWLRNLLQDSLVRESFAEHVDISQLIDTIARRDPVHRIPHAAVASLAYGAQVIVDTHPSMRPYHEDQSIVMRELSRLLRSDQIQIVSVDGDPRWRIDGTGEPSHLPRPRHGWGVLVLSNLGTGPAVNNSGLSRQNAWLEFGQRLQQQGHPVVALSPGAIDRVPPSVRRTIKTVSWDTKPTIPRVMTGQPTSSDRVAHSVTDRRLRRAARGNPQVIRLAKYLSLASRITRPLLRRARLEFCPDADAGLEAELWFSALVQTRSPDSILLFPSVAKELQQQLLNSGELAPAWKLLQRFHDFRPSLARLQEQITWLSLGHDDDSRQQLDAAVASIIKSVVQQDRGGLGQWALSMLKRTDLEQRSDRAGVLRAVVQQGSTGAQSTAASLGNQSVADSVRAIIAIDSPTVDVGVFLRDNELRFSEPPEVGAEILKISDQPVRRLFVDSSPLTWDADQPPPSISVAAGATVALQVEGIGQYVLQPIGESVEKILEFDTFQHGFVVSANGEVSGPAFALTPQTIVTTRRVLAATGLANTADFEIQLGEQSTLSRLPKSAVESETDLQRSDELVALEVGGIPIDVSPSTIGEADEGAIVYALSCSGDGKPKWARFQIANVDGLGLRLQSIGMQRWLEQQSWSGALLFDSESNQCVGVAVVALGGLTIQKPDLPQPTKLKSAPKLTRNRAPRLQITYDVEASGAIIKKEIPFVIGVVGDFAGMSMKRQGLSDRKFLQVDRDNFDAVMASMRPELQLRVANHLSGDGSEMAVQLAFDRIGDFHPTMVVQQIEPLHRMLKSRKALAHWLLLLDQHDGIELAIRNYLADWKQTAQDAHKGGGPSDFTGSSTPFESQSEFSIDDSKLLSELAAYMPSKRAKDIAPALIELFMRKDAPDDFQPYALIEDEIRRIDSVLSRQVTEILHHPDFQHLEGMWRGLRFLVDRTETGPNLKIRMLQASKEELRQDFDHSPSFAESTFFRRVYDEEFEVFGGEPFGAIVADYSFTTDAKDVGLLNGLSAVAASAYCPILTSPTPSVFGLESFDQIHQLRDLGKGFESTEKVAWRALRDSDDARYLVMVMPRILARRPYADTNNPAEEFALNELDGQPDGVIDNYCWMNAAYGYAERLASSFSRTGNCLAIRGVEAGGRLEGLPTHIFRSEDGDLDMTCPTEVQISDRHEKELSDLGFLPLCHYKNTDYAVFFGATTMHRPRHYEDPEASANARIFSNVPAIMIASRFAHYLKVISRDCIGKFTEVKELEQLLANWIMNYTLAENDQPADVRARYPLRDVSVQVDAVQGQPGVYSASVTMRPYLQLEEMSSPMLLTVPLPRAR